MEPSKRPHPHLEGHLPELCRALQSKVIISAGHEGGSVAMLSASGLAWGHCCLWDGCSPSCGIPAPPSTPVYPKQAGGATFASPLPQLVWQLLDGATVFLCWNITFEGFSFPLLTDVRCRDRLKMKAWLPESNYRAIKSNQWSGSLCWRRGLWKGFLFQLILEKLKCPVSSAVWPLARGHLHRVAQALLEI